MLQTLPAVQIPMLQTALCLGLRKAHPSAPKPLEGANSRSFFASTAFRARTSQSQGWQSHTVCWSADEGAGNCLEHLIVDLLVAKLTKTTGVEDMGHISARLVLHLPPRQPKAHAEALVRQLLNPKPQSPGSSTSIWLGLRVPTSGVTQVRDYTAATESSLRLGQDMAECVHRVVEGMHVWMDGWKCIHCHAHLTIHVCIYLYIYLSVCL